MWWSNNEPLMFRLDTFLKRCTVRIAIKYRVVWRFPGARWNNLLNSALWSREACMNNTTGCCWGSAAPSTKDRGQNALPLKKKRKKSRRAQTHWENTVLQPFCFVFKTKRVFKNKKQTRVQPLPSRWNMNMQSPVKKAPVSVHQHKAER